MPIEDYELKKILTSANEIIRTNTSADQSARASDNPDKQKISQAGHETS